jgi:response regulator RpfG family c-di-GMP phosphodiesterase
MSELTESISRKVLFVDDEMLLLEGINRQLRREYTLSIASSGQAALETLQREGPFAVVVSDFNMPGMDGVAFLNQVHQQHPDTVLIMLTGRAELDIAVNALHHAHIARFLNKPCPKEILQETLNDCLEQYRLRKSEQLLQARLQEANQQLSQLNEHLEAMVAQKTRALQLQYDYVARTARMNDSKAIIDAFVQSVEDLTNLHHLTLWLSPQQNGQFNCHFPSNHTLPTFSATDCGNGIIASTLVNHLPWISKQSSLAITAFDAGTFSHGLAYLCQPLTTQQGVLGLLNLSCDNGDCQLDSSELAALAGMADVTATALQSHWNHEAFADAQDSIITALAKLSEYRDPETGSHLLRLKQYSTLLCNHLSQLTEYKARVNIEFTKDLARSSPLHDIGKVGIPDAILKKPGKLTAEEFEIMKDHAKIGGDTLRSVYDQYPSQNFIKCGMEIAYGHHEKWNGSGYPYGLSGEEIPLSARILSLVDVYDALTCHRVYKAPFSRKQANAIIVEGRGTHFDPGLVDAFLSIESDFNKIAEQFADTF